MTSYIRTLKDKTGKDIIYPQTKSKAVYMESGSTVEEVITTLENNINSRAPKENPAFTGTPTAPTATKGTDTNQVATTKFVQEAIADFNPGGGSAADTTYDNSNSNINATNVQDAIDIVYDKLFPKLNITIINGANSSISLTDGTHTITGTASSEGKVTFRIPVLGTWTVTATLSEMTTTEVINISELTDTYNLTMEYFSATLTVNALYGGEGATITATCDGCTYTGTTNASGQCVLTVRRQGTYTVVGSYENAYSNTKQVYIATEVDNNPNYTVELMFIALTIVGDANILLTVTDGTTVLTRNSTGQDIFILPNTGTWTVTGTLQGNDVGEQITISSYGAFSKDLYYVNTSFGNTSWAVIQAITKAGRASSYWAVGNYKTFSCSGNIAGGAANSYTWYAVIMGFNHNPTYEGTNTIHVRFVNRGIYGAYCVGYSSNNSSAPSNGTLYMNSTGTNEGGWNDSYMRNTTCTTFYNTNIPSELRAVLGSCTKYTDNSGLGKFTADAVTATTDYIFLPSEFEVWGVRQYSNPNEQNKQAQYQYFINGNKKALMSCRSHTCGSVPAIESVKSLGTTDARGYYYTILWTRSPSASGYFCDTEFSHDSNKDYTYGYYKRSYRSANVTYGYPTRYSNSYSSGYLYYMSTGFAPYGVIK